MKAFDRAEQLSSRHIDRVMGETVGIHPRHTPPNGRAVPDPERPSVNLRVVWSGEAVRDSKVHEHVDVISKDSMVSYDLRNLPYELKQGDRVFRPKVGRSYRVKAILPDGQGRCEVGLQVMS